MPTIASEKDLITKHDCDKNVKLMTEKIDKIKENLNFFELSVTEKLASMPKALADEFDKRYADKKTELDVDKIKWLVIGAVVVSLIGIVLK